jgi:hypothetical protein
MNSLIDHFGEQCVGWVLRFVAAVCGLTAAALIWTASERWLGIYSLDKAQVAALSNDQRTMITTAKEAATYLPDLATTGLLAIDWTDPQATSEIERWFNRLPSSERPPIQTMLALHQRLHHLPSSQNLNGSDGQLLTVIDKLLLGKSSPAIPLVTSDPPAAPIQGYALQLRFIATWSLNDRHAIHQASGDLCLAMPRHPEQRYISLIHQALTSSVSSTVVVDLAKPLSTDVGGKALLLILRRLITLAPERSAALVPLIPADSRTPGENALLLGTDRPLEQQVASALKPGTIDFTVVALIERCLTEQRYDLAKQLAESLKEPARMTWACAVAQAAGDLSTLQRLTSDTAYLPTAYGLQQQDGHLRFHLLSPAGIVPTTPLEVRIGGKLIANNFIKRYGSLVDITLGEQRGAIVINCEKTTIYASIIP